MADEWGTREELLHPRDSHGRFRNSFKMSGAAIERVMRILTGFSPKTFQSDADAATYVHTLARPGKGGRSNPVMDRLMVNYAQMNTDLRARRETADTKAMDAAMKPLPESVILSRVVGPEAFGLKPQDMDRMEEYTGKLVADRGYSSANIGTPIGSQGPSITLVMAVPAGTRAVVPSAGTPSREVILDREQPLRITKVTPDGKGGWYVMAVAMEKGSKGETRTKKLGTRLRKGKDDTVTLPDTPVTPPVPQGQAPQAPAPQPAPMQAPVRPKQGRPAGPGPGPRNEPLAAESIGTGSTKPAPAPEAPKVEETPSPTPPSPGKVEEPVKAPTPTKRETQTVTPAPAPATPDEDIARARREERRKVRQEREAKVKAEERADRARKEKERAARQAEADKRAQDEEMADLQRQVDEIAATVGEPAPTDEMSKRLIALMAANVKAKRTSKKGAAETIRKSSLRDISPGHKRFLDKWADSLSPKVVERQTGQGPAVEGSAPSAPVTPQPTGNKFHVRQSRGGRGDVQYEVMRTTPEGKETLVRTFTGYQQRKAENLAKELDRKENLKPERKTPSMAVGKTNANRVQVGERILVRKNPTTGEWEASSTKTGATPITVTGKDPFRRGNRTGISLRGTDDQGNEVRVKGGPSIQTFWTAPAVTTQIPAPAEAPVTPQVDRVPQQWGGVPDWLSSKSDEELQRAMKAIFDRPPSNAREIALDAIDAELTRREGKAKLEAESRDVDLEADTHLESGGAYTDLDMDPSALEQAQRLALVDGNRRPGERREQAVRRMYLQHVHDQWLQAEDDTRGQLLNRAGVQAGISPTSLWGATPERARRYASPELLEWWATHGGRSTYTDFRAQWLGGREERQAAMAKRGRSRGRDFEV